MTKDLILKIAKEKDLKSFYKKYPSEEAFMKVHGKAFKKAQVGTYIGGEKDAPLKPINFNEAYDEADYSITGSTNKMRQEEAYKQAELEAKQKGGGGGFDIAGLMSLAGSAMGGEDMGDMGGAMAARYGRNIPRAQNGDWYTNNPPAGATNYGQMQPANQLKPMGSTNNSVGGIGASSLPNSIGKQAPASSDTLGKIGGAIGKYAGPAGELIQGISALKAQKEAVKGAQQTQQLSDLSLQASQTRPEETKRKYVRPEDMVTSDNQVSPTYGTGTNVLSRNGKQIRKAKGGAEIQNTYAPNYLYDDLGYEPLNDSNIKKYQDGGTPWGMIGNIGSDIGGAIVGKDAGSQIGGTLGKTIGNAIMPGIGGAVLGTVGTVVGGLLDTSDEKMKKAQDATNRNMQSMAFGQSAQALQAQNSAVMRNGGMESFRAGGHLRDYQDPSEEAMETYAMGGELKTHWGGHMEEMSENPYLPDGGVTYMPHGQSHEESDGNGRTGIGITYGDNPVEVERREPIMKLKDGSTGEDNLVVFGNLKIPKYGVEMLGDKKAEGMKFKNYVSNLSKNETKQNKTIQKFGEELADMNPLTSYDKLKVAGLQANILGGNMKLKEIADTKTKAAALQNAINDTAEEYGFNADSLAKGNIKTAKFGGKFSMAEKGKKVKLKKPELSRDVEEITPVNNIRTNAQKEADANRYSRIQSDIVGEDYDEMMGVRPISDSVLNPVKESFDVDPYMQLANSVLSYFRPSDAEELNGNQLLGEMYALSNNQEEPVQAQQFSPELTSAYSISLQDQMNEITAQTRAAQRMAQGNPAAQAAIAAQAYEAINKVKGEEFRINQGMADKTYTSNIAAMNDAKLKNLGILDQQYSRQAQAKSNTKAVAQAALNSISDKYAKNSLENRTLQTYENMYNYRYDANGRLINMNGVAQFNPYGSQLGAGARDTAPEGYEYETILKKKSKTKDAKNGSIVKAMRNL